MNNREILVKLLLMFKWRIVKMHLPTLLIPITKWVSLTRRNLMTWKSCGLSGILQMLIRRIPLKILSIQMKIILQQILLNLTKNKTQMVINNVKSWRMIKLNWEIHMMKTILKEIKMWKEMMDPHMEQPQRKLQA